MAYFEWDENKNRLNQQKHKIAFEDATDVFNDKDRLEFRSDKEGERRSLTIGKAFQAIITVVYTTRDLWIRLISARRASADERRAYLSNKLKDKDHDAYPIRFRSLAENTGRGIPEWLFY